MRQVSSSAGKAQHGGSYTRSGGDRQVPDVRDFNSAWLSLLSGTDTVAASSPDSIGTRGAGASYIARGFRTNGTQLQVA